MMSSCTFGFWKLNSNTPYTSLNHTGDKIKILLLIQILLSTKCSKCTQPLTVPHDGHGIDVHEQAIQGIMPVGIIDDLALVEVWLLHKDPDVHVIATQVKAVRF